MRLKLAGFAIIGTLALTGCASSPAASRHVVSLPDLVLTAAQTTLAQHTADLTLTGSMTVAGHTVQMSGTGVGNLSRNDLKMTMAMNLAGNKATITELFVNSRLYMAFTMGGQSFRQLTGHDWIAMPMVSGNGAGLSGGNPMQALATLAQKGATVTSLGPSDIDGLTVNGYSVTPDRAAMLASAEKALATAELPAAMRSAALQTLQASPTPTFKVWIDPAHNLLRRMTTSLGLNLPTGNSSTGSFVMDFTHYGVPVNITAPPANDVTSYQQFLQHLGR